MKTKRRTDRSGGRLARIGVRGLALIGALAVLVCSNRLAMEEARADVQTKSLLVVGLDPRQPRSVQSTIVDLRKEVALLRATLEKIERRLRNP